MYERFTDRARKVMFLANRVARRFDHEYVSTEHVLLALVEEHAGVAVGVLMQFDVYPARVRQEILKLVRCNNPSNDLGKLPMTPLAKKALAYAVEEARELRHDYVGSEHLLLGLMREENGVAAQVLAGLGLKLPDARKAVVRFLGYSLEPEPPPRPAPAFADAAPEPPPPAAVPDPDRERMAAELLQARKRLDEQQGQFASLNRQLWNVRMLLGTLVGALSGGVIAGHLGAVLGLAAGTLVAAVGRPVVGALAAVVPGAVIGHAYLADEGGAVVGAVLGVFLGACVGGIGWQPRRKGAPSA